MQEYFIWKFIRQIEIRAYFQIFIKQLSKKKNRIIFKKICIKRVIQNFFFNINNLGNESFLTFMIKNFSKNFYSNLKISLRKINVQDIRPISNDHLYFNDGLETSTEGKKDETELLKFCHSFGIYIQCYNSYFMFVFRS